MFKFLKAIKDICVSVFSNIVNYFYPSHVNNSTNLIGNNHYAIPNNLYIKPLDLSYMIAEDAVRKAAFDNTFNEMRSRKLEDSLKDLNKKFDVLEVYRQPKKHDLLWKYDNSIIIGENYRNLKKDYELFKHQYPSSGTFRNDNKTGTNYR